LTDSAQAQLGVDGYELELSVVVATLNEPALQTYLVDG